jgi:hypothetical protein
MKKSFNKPVGKSTTKFYNVYKGKNENKYFFYLPCIGVSPTKNLHWGMKVRSIFLAWGNWFIQYNICEVVSDTNLELTKEGYENLKKSLQSSGMVINDLQGAMNFIKNNIHIVQILRNSNTEHPYVKKVLATYFHNQPFIDMN